MSAHPVPWFLLDLSLVETSKKSSLAVNSPDQSNSWSQPTRGLDVGSIEYIHTRLLEKRDAGCAILLVSTELDEVMELSDRIAVMFDGKIIAVVEAEGATKEQIGLLMAGVVEA